MPAPRSRIHLIKRELKEHLPFTLLGVAASLLILFLLEHFSIGQGHHGHGHEHGLEHGAAESFFELFHVSHFAHIFLSAIASSAIYLRHSHTILKTTVIATVSAISFCSVSDVCLPFLGGKLFGMPVAFHIDLIEAPLWVIFAALSGSLLGILAEKKFGRISYFTHGSHVFVSSLASLLYLVSFGLDNWMGQIVGVFTITTFAVVIPCCSSDIIFPMSFVGGIHGHEHEDEHTHH